jgi:hypothetical protein
MVSPGGTEGGTSAARQPGTPCRAGTQHANTGVVDCKAVGSAALQTFAYVCTIVGVGTAAMQSKGRLYRHILNAQVSGPGAGQLISAAVRHAGLPRWHHGVNVHIVCTTVHGNEGAHMRTLAPRESMLSWMSRSPAHRNRTQGAVEVSLDNTHR